MPRFAAESQRLEPKWLLMLTILGFCTCQRTPLFGCSFCLAGLLLLLLVCLLDALFRLSLQSILCWMVGHSQQRNEDGKQQDVSEVEGELLVRKGKDLVHDVCENTQFLRLCDDAHLVELTKNVEASSRDEEEKHRKNDAIKKSGWSDNLHGGLWLGSAVVAPVGVSLITKP